MPSVDVISKEFNFGKPILKVSVTANLTPKMLLYISSGRITPIFDMTCKVYVLIDISTADII